MGAEDTPSGVCTVDVVAIVSVAGASAPPAVETAPPPPPPPPDTPRYDRYAIAATLTATNAAIATAAGGPAIGPSSNALAAAI